LLGNLELGVEGGFEVESVNPGLST
jgi:hypothetical protein